MSQPHLKCDNLTIKIEHRTLVRDLSLNIAGGNFVALLGTNGVGKTLTLQTLAGLRDSGKHVISLNGDDMGELTRRDISLRLGMLLQIHEDTFPLTVQESVMMGRYPHLGMWQWPGRSDYEAAATALRAFDLDGLEERPLAALSGGERERVALAALYVQSPDIWLLDEPMNHLDPRHQLQVLRTMKTVAAGGKVVIASLHNPAMAIRFADFALLFYGDGDWEYGPANELLEPGRLERVYGTPFSYFSNDSERLLMPA
jgi:iron complex transport system ATP-binding protein